MIACVCNFVCNYVYLIACLDHRQKKGKKGEGKCIDIALIFVVHARRSGMDHTVVPAITPMPAWQWLLGNLFKLGEDP